MKISVNGVDLFELNDLQKKVITDEISTDIFEEDMKRRLQWVLMHKYERCYERLQKEWLPRLAENGVQSIPVDRDELIQLIFDQPDYKDRAARDADGAAKLKNQ